MEEGAKLNIYDPQVKFEQIQMDLSLEKFAWDGPAHTLKAKYAPIHLLGLLLLFHCNPCLLQINRTPREHHKTAASQQFNNEPLCKPNQASAP